METDDVADAGDPSSLRSTRYSRVAIWLHWLIALTLAFELALGFAMPKDAAGFALWQLHKSVGISVLLLTLLRLGWRLLHRPPPMTESGLTAFLARAVHAGFYAVMLLGPLTGWALVSSSDVVVPTVLFGLVPFPHLPIGGEFNAAATQAHEALAWIALGLIALHIVGVVRHEWLMRHGVLGRMSPGGRAAIGALLGVAVALVGLASFALIGQRAPNEPATPPALAGDLGGGEAVPGATDAPAVPAASPTPEDKSVSTDPAALPAWTIRPGGRLGFSVANGAETVAGRFNRWSGTIRFDPERPETADVVIEVDLASATVGDATQDEMLAGEEYFAVGAFPKATVRMTSARRIGDGRYEGQGTISLKGVNRPQTIAFRLTGAGQSRRVEGTASIARAPFGIGTGSSSSGLAPTVNVSFGFDAETTAPGR